MSIKVNVIVVLVNYSNPGCISMQLSFSWHEF